MNLPGIGFGCSPFRAGGRVDLEPAVREALRLGYRLLDVAEMYGNERAVGRALRDAEAAPRIVGKVWRTNYRPEHLLEACQRSLTRLGVEAFDVYLLHAPGAWRHVAPLDDIEEIGWEEFQRRTVPETAGAIETDDVPLEETWSAMRELQGRGLARDIGVSNFAPAQIERLHPRPTVSEIAFSPLEQNLEEVAFCRRSGIAVLAHSPLARAGLRDHPTLRRIGQSLGRTPAQVALRWTIEHGAIPLPSSTRSEHIAENLDTLSFALPAEAIARIADIGARTES